MLDRITAIVVSAACFSCASCSSTPAETSDAGADAALDAPVIATNTTLALDGDPNGVYWDSSTSTLYIADDGNNRILSYTDAAGITKYADLPAAPAMGPGLGQLIRLTDGTLLVTRFGYGTTGDIVDIAPDLTTTIIPKLDVAKRRIGLAQSPDGTIYDTYFVKNGTGYVGAVATVTLAGVETDIVTGLAKPVGVLVTGDKLAFDDQSNNALYATPLASPGALTQTAQLPAADLLCDGPNGSLFSGGADGNVRAIDASGAVTVFATGFAQARGVAYDAKNGRLFIANHVGTVGQNTIEVRPVQ